jgi:hypothetical protein
MVRSEGAKWGVSFGSALAIAISFTTKKSILWAIIHDILGGLYVIYFACSGRSRRRCANLYSINQAAIIAPFRVIKRYVANVNAGSVFPDYSAPGHPRRGPLRTTSLFLP